MSIREEAENERQKLKNMSWKDRAWYVWEYYKFHLLAVILVIGVLSTIGTMIYRQTFTTRLSVAIINDRSAGASSSALLESELREYMGCGKKDLIEINEGLMVDFNEESTSQYGYATLSDGSKPNWGSYKDKYAYFKQYKKIATYMKNDTDSNDWIDYFQC